jgi:hypothetical protein
LSERPKSRQERDEEQHLPLRGQPRAHAAVRCALMPM